MNCRVCYAELKPGSSTCPVCSTPFSSLPPDAPTPSAPEELPDLGPAPGYGGPSLGMPAPAPPPYFPGGPFQAQQPIPSHLVISIVSVFFCTILGIVAVVFAAQVSGRQAVGDISGALEASRKARLFALVGLGIGVPLVAIAVLGSLLGALSGSSGY